MWIGAVHSLRWLKGVGPEPLWLVAGLTLGLGACYYRAAEPAKGQGYAANGEGREPLVGGEPWVEGAEQGAPSGYGEEDGYQAAQRAQREVQDAQARGAWRFGAMYDMPPAPPPAPAGDSATGQAPAGRPTSEDTYAHEDVERYRDVPAADERGGGSADSGVLDATYRKLRGAAEYMSAQGWRLWLKGRKAWDKAFNETKETRQGER